MPTSAVENRQPNGVSPKKYSPTAIVHLPTGGWTMKEGESWKTSRVRQLPSLARILSLALSTKLRS